MGSRRDMGECAGAVAVTDRRYGIQVLPGFQEPKPWHFDQCRRREPVLDLDRSPPTVVRSVGWRLCLRCKAPFFSPDVVGIRLCDSCKGTTHTQTRSA